MRHSLSPFHPAGVRKSTRKRTVTDRLLATMETPLYGGAASSSSAAPSTSAAGGRTRGRTASIVRGNAFETPSIRYARTWLFPPILPR